MHYDENLNLQHVENPSVSWVISDIKRQTHSSNESDENGGKTSLIYDGSECDIRFMLKTQVGFVGLCYIAAEVE